MCMGNASSPWQLLPHGRNAAPLPAPHPQMRSCPPLPAFNEMLRLANIHGDRHSVGQVRRGMRPCIMATASMCAVCRAQEQAPCIAARSRAVLMGYLQRRTFSGCAPVEPGSGHLHAGRCSLCHPSLSRGCPSAGDCFDTPAAWHKRTRSWQHNSFAPCRPARSVGTPH